MHIYKRFRLRSVRESFDPVLSPEGLPSAFGRTSRLTFLTLPSVVLMSIPTVSYEDFSTSNQATVEYGGPWNLTSDEPPALSCTSYPQDSCGGYCLYCYQNSGVAPLVNHGSFVTNISVNLADYGGATSLGFTWNYWPLYSGEHTTDGTSIPITSQVGDAKFEESFPAGNWAVLLSDHTGLAWNYASKISHNGSTSLVRGSDPNLGYIAIKINVTMAGGDDEALFFYVKGIKFLITTPMGSAAASSSSATSTQQVGGSSAPSSSSTTQARVVAGAVVGAVALLALATLAVCLFRRRHKKGENPVGDTVIYTQQINQEAPKLLEVPILPPDLNTHYHSASLHPTPFVSSGSYGPLPTYGPDELTGQDRVLSTPFSPELARFAAANREAINENLEARLQAAGYLPTENPSRLTPEEWKNEYGITKLELMRLQNLYERTRQVQPP